MKRITKIEIENYRAFFGNYKIELPKGENLLVYGENGSGKSSLFKALNNYLSSSRDASVTFTKNHYSPAPDGEIKLSFQDFDNVTFVPIAGTEQDLTFGSAASTNAIQFVKDAELIKGFLDYRNLLDVYFHNEPKPNLFELIVLKILGKQFNVAKTFRFAEKWTQLQKDLIDNSYTRNDRSHQDALAELPVYHSALETILKDVFKVLNTELLKKYFPELNIELRFELKPMTFNYETWKWQWHTTADLRLKVFQNGVAVQDNYNDFLNEARLAAFAICIYLAALKRNPEAIDYKILFLDDVFVGLDTSNRIPILKILQKEFPQHQIVVATYDRHLYELASRQFETETPGKWKKAEFYVGKDKIGTQDYEKPIIVKGETNFEKGTQYLHDRVKPDYPASANYFRKALEELIQEFIPKWETADAENTQIAAYKLGSLIYKSKNFISKTGISTLIIDEIISFLPTLLHPLSHHEISAPIYKGELLRIETLIQLWTNELKGLDIKTKYRATILKDKSIIQIKYILNAPTNKHFYFIIKLTETLVLINDGANNLSISAAKNTLQERWGEENNVKQPNAKHSYTKIEKKLPKNNFISIKDAYDKIYNEVLQLPGMIAFPPATNYLNDIEYLDVNGVYQPLNNLIVW